MTADWTKAQEWERNWWMTRRERHVIERVKADLVAKLMLIERRALPTSVIDIGGGPQSLLLRIARRNPTVLDPLEFADLEKAYTTRKIKRMIKPGEQLCEADGQWDEAWIYNCLQHVISPTAVIQAAKSVASVVRIFEWTHIEPYEGHLHKLTPEGLHTCLSFGDWKQVTGMAGWFDDAVNEMHGNFFAAVYEAPR